MTPAGRTTPNWKITLKPRNADPDGPAQGGTLEYLPVGAELVDAIDTLELYADIMRQTGRVPISLEFRSQALIHIGKRLGKRTFQVRCDGWERETGNGYDNGYGYLRVEETYE